MPDSNYIIIVGCGRLGCMLASQLCGAGKSVVTIDRNPKAFDNLSIDFSGYKIVGDAVEVSVLHEAEIKKAGTVFAVTTKDSTNLMVAQVASEIFGVPNVVARVYDPKRETVYREFGIQTISPTQLSAAAFLQRIPVKVS
jgi:trk system potassium uptake protein